MAGRFKGAAIDLADGYIHFSTSAQAVETARLHFAGQAGLLLVAVDATLFGEALKWEPSRGGALFPHLYDVLSLEAVRRVVPLPVGEDGAHLFPHLHADLPLDAVIWEKLLPLGDDGLHVFPPMQEDPR